MSLRTVLNAQKYVSKVRQSQFISYIRRIESIPDFRSWLSQVKKDHYDCSHACWAYRIYEDNQLIKHSSDAGEPSGTAGRPILMVLEQYHIIQTGIIIVRYFGGTKLGKRGLIDAYSESAKNVVDKSKLILWTDYQFYRVTCPMRYYGILSKNIMSINGKIIKDQSGEELKWVIQIDRSMTNKLIKMVSSSTIGEGNLVKMKKESNVEKT